MFAQTEGFPIQDELVFVSCPTVLHSFLPEAEHTKALKTKSIGGLSPDSFSLRSRSMIMLKAVLYRAGKAIGLASALGVCPSSLMHHSLPCNYGASHFLEEAQSHILFIIQA